MRGSRKGKRNVSSERAHVRQADQIAREHKQGLDIQFSAAASVDVQLLVPQELWQPHNYLQATPNYLQRTCRFSPVLGSV